MKCETPALYLLFLFNCCLKMQSSIITCPGSRRLVLRYGMRRGGFMFKIIATNGKLVNLPVGWDWIIWLSDTRFYPVARVLSNRMWINFWLAFTCCRTAID